MTGKIDDSVGAAVGASALRFPPIDDMFRQLSLTVRHVWKNDLSRQDIEQWLANFTGEVLPVEKEHQIALWLLSHFVFFSESEVRHLCRTLYRDYLHRMVEESPHSTAEECRSAINKNLIRSRFYFLGRPGESSAFVLYPFRQENRLGMQSFISSRSPLPSFVDTVVFVDDVTLSAEQATKYVSRNDYGLDIGSRRVLLLTFCATPKAIELLGNADIDVITCILLDERSRCFVERSNIFDGMPAEREESMAVARAYGTRLWPKHPLGWDDGQYAFGFYYNTPDNSLPIFWSEESGWRPIMRRYGKIEHKWADDDHDIFI